MTRAQDERLFIHGLLQHVDASGNRLLSYAKIRELCREHGFDPPPSVSTIGNMADEIEEKRKRGRIAGEEQAKRSTVREDVWAACDRFIAEQPDLTERELSRLVSAAVTCSRQEISRYKKEWHQRRDEK